MEVITRTRYIWYKIPNFTPSLRIPLKHVHALKMLSCHLRQIMEHKVNTSIIHIAAQVKSDLCGMSSMFLSKAVPLPVQEIHITMNIRHKNAQ